jgi:cytochrome c-type biogenesis protein CcmF
MSIATLGTAAILVLFGTALATVALSAVGARRSSERLIEAGVRALHASTALAAFCSALIVYAFIADDFSIQYVQHTSDAALPLFFKLTAFWGGLDGSLLFWVLLLTVFSSMAVATNRRRHEAMIPHVVAVLGAIITFFVALLVFLKNPFSPFLVETHLEGRGLNPLLQNAYMVIHPPSLYLGYVSQAIPFAFGMGALLTGQVDEAWQASMRRWTLFSWSFLSLGLVLGGLWAYEELGWGGYWAWDPVENAGLLPWFTATAFLHSIMIQERRGMMRVWNLVLVILSFWLSIVGTFLTRSGVVQSVHAFGRDPQLAWTFGGFMVVILVFGLGLVWWRRDLLRSRGELESVLSREFAFMLNNWILLVMAFFVLGSTVWPTISEWLGERIAIRESHFNHYMAPAGLALLLLMGVGPLLAWRRSSPDSLRKQFTIPLSFGVVGVVIPAVLGLDDMWGLACFGLCTFTLATISQEFVRGIRVASRGRPGPDGKPVRVGLLEASIRLVLRARRRYGGYIIHLGVVLMFFGFAGKTYDSELKIKMRPGDVVQIAEYEVRHGGIEVDSDWQREMITAKLEVFVDGEQVDTLTPARWWYFQTPDQPTTEVSRRMTFGHDLYSSVQTFELATGWTQVQLFINPLVNWIWVGTVVLLFGGAICIGTRRKERDLSHG